MKQAYVTVNVNLMKTTVAVGDNSNSSQIQNTLGSLVVPILSVRSHCIEDMSHPMTTNILHQMLCLYFSSLKRTSCWWQELISTMSTNNI